MSKENPSSLPGEASCLSKSDDLRHIAIIMDGNGRWARNKGKSKIFGHRKGAEVARLITQTTAERNIPYLTLYSFSSENWQRPPDEIDDLMNLLRYYIKKEAKSLRKNNIQLRVIGDKQYLPKDIVDLIQDIEEQKLLRPKLTVIMALSYGARQEITLAMRQLAHKVEQKQMVIDDINPDSVAQFLGTSGIPDPDMIIRTGGELRLSNFLLWQAAYSELFFTQTLWPSFSVEEYDNMIQQFLKRERRYGTTR